MEVRTYYASTVEAAFALAKREFGTEAMLMQSNRSPQGVDPRGQYEVVFAGEPLSLPAGSKAPAPNLDWPLHVWNQPISAPSGLVRPGRVPTGHAAFGPVDLVRRPPVPPAPVAVAQRLAPRSQRELQVTCNPGLVRFALSSYTVALVGPTGSGKTTTAMKLAVRYGSLASRPCRLIAYDPDRVGTTERLRHFANLLKIPFQTVDTPALLSTAISVRTPGLTLIDTPGCARADDQALAGLAFALGSHSDVETQLVLRADRRLVDNIAAGARLSVLSPKRLILTALDETTDYSEIEALAIAAALPLSFLGTGQKIPDDLEPATMQRLETLVRRGWALSQAAAA